MNKVIASLILILTMSWLTAALANTRYERLDGMTTQSSMDGDSVIDTIRRRGLLKVGVGLFEPWVMCGTDGELIGYEIDVARQLASDIGVRLQHVRTDWYYIVPALLEEEFDLVISGMGITPERSLLVNFSIPYSEFGILIAANAEAIEGSRDPESAVNFNLPEVVFGARAGTVPAQVVMDRFPQATLRLFDSDSNMLMSLLAGEIHAVAGDQIKVRRWLSEHEDVLYQPFEQLFNKLPEAIALRKGDLDGVNFLSSWIEHYKANGWLDERRQYWFDSQDWEGTLTMDPEVLEHCEESFTF